MVSMLLIAAVLASLASGVLIAYGLCLGMFWVMRRRAALSRQRMQLAEMAIKS